MSESKCACQCVDARQCFLARYPECRRNSDGRHLYDETMFEECECVCHEENDLPKLSDLMGLCADSPIDVGGGWDE